MKANLSRLRILEQFERHHVPKAQFDMNSWVSGVIPLDGQDPISCGTEACGLGWAAMIPRLKRLGLRIREDQLAVEYKGTFGLFAARKFFGLSEDEALWLFGRLRYNGRFTRPGSDRTTMTPFEHAEMLGRFIDCKVKNKMDEMVWDEKPVVES